MIDRVPVCDRRRERKRKRKRKWKQVQYARPPFSVNCVHKDLLHHHNPARPSTYAAVGFETEKARVCACACVCERARAYVVYMYACVDCKQLIATVIACAQVFDPFKVSIKNLEGIYKMSDSEDELFEAEVRSSVALAFYGHALVSGSELLCTHITAIIVRVEIFDCGCSCVRT